MVTYIAVAPDHGSLHDVREGPYLLAGSNLVALAKRKAVDEDAGWRGMANRANRSPDAPACKGGFDCRDAEIGLRQSELGIDRQAQALASPVLGYRKGTGPVSERGVGFQFVQGEWIVDPGANPSIVEGLQHTVAAGQPDHIEMMDAAGRVQSTLDILRNASS
jgi:hypothetical protein